MATAPIVIGLIESGHGHGMVEGLEAALYGRFARVGNALARSLRLMLLDVLARGESAVVRGTVGAKMANTSAQLQVLRTPGLLATRRQGTHGRYSLADGDVN